MLADGDGVADTLTAAGDDDAVVVEAAVGPHGELTGGSGVAHAAQRLPQEVGGAPRRVGSALAQSGHQHVAGASGDGEQRMIAPHAGVVVALRPLLGRAVGLAHSGVQTVESRSMVSGSAPGPAPADQARVCILAINYRVGAVARPWVPVSGVQNALPGKASIIS